MKRLNLLAFILVLLTSLMSCDKGTNELKRARSVGGTSEILFVTQNDEQWNGQMGQAVRDFFEQEQYGLPQPEKNFKWWCPFGTNPIIFIISEGNTAICNL